MDVGTCSEAKQLMSCRTGDRIREGKQGDVF